MLLKRTDKARAELSPGVRTLGLRERSLLLLADGSKSVADFRPLFDGDGEQIVLGLVQAGYLEATGAAAAAKATPASGDAFEGKRSMATTRMFLFDICERMFARRNPVQAEQFREALRNAKDRDTMLEAARAMVAEIEQAAGHERADSISERIAMLLPPEAVT